MKVRANAVRLLESASGHARRLWFDGTLYSRLNSKADDVIIIVMQRPHMDDLVAHVTETDDWVKIDIQARQASPARALSRC